MIVFWGLSSVGRASVLQAECHRFDSDSLHQVKQWILACESIVIGVYGACY